MAALKWCRGRRCYAVGVFDPPPPAAGRGAGRAEPSVPKTSAYNCPPISALRYLPFYFCLPISAFLFLPSVLSVSEAYLKTSACPFSEVRLWSLSRRSLSIEVFEGDQAHAHRRASIFWRNSAKTYGFPREIHAFSMLSNLSLRFKQN